MLTSSNIIIREHGSTLSTGQAQVGQTHSCSKGEGNSKPGQTTQDKSPDSLKEYIIIYFLPKLVEELKWFLKMIINTRQNLALSNTNIILIPESFNMNISHLFTALEHKFKRLFCTLQNRV